MYLASVLVVAAARVYNTIVSRKAVLPAFAVTVPRVPRRGLAFVLLAYLILHVLKQLKKLFKAALCARYKQNFFQYAEDCLEGTAP